MVATMDKTPEQIDRVTAREILRGDEDRAAAIIQKVRAEAAAKALSARPDDSAVERVIAAVEATGLLAGDEARDVARAAIAALGAGASVALDTPPRT